MNESDVVVIGGGIVGCASARAIQLKYPKLKITLVEKELAIGQHQTGHNSGVIHSGIYYTPGSLKAKNCVRGRKMLVEFAKKHNIAHDICGKVIVATKESEFPNLERIYNNGVGNGVEGIEIIDQKRIKEIEPFCNGIKAIHVPCAGIIDYVGVAKKIAEEIKEINVNSQIRLGEEVVSIKHREDFVTITTSKVQIKAKYVVFCCGLQADYMAKKDGVQLKEKIVPFRGDYYELTPTAKHKVNGLIYPVPDPQFPFLGVHFTKMVNGEVECGPNAVFSFKKEGYGRMSFSLKDTFNSLTYTGTWKLFKNNWRYGLGEYRRAFSKQRFLDSLKTLIPDLTLNEIRSAKTGVRAQLLTPDGDTKDDFRIVKQRNSIHVLNAPSPAATASLAIGEQIAEEFAEVIG